MQGGIHAQARDHRGRSSQVSQAFICARTTYRRDDWREPMQVHTHGCTALHAMQTAVWILVSLAGHNRSVDDQKLYSLRSNLYFV